MKLLVEAEPIIRLVPLYPSLIVSRTFPQITFLESSTIVTVGRSAEPSLPLVTLVPSSPP